MAATRVGIRGWLFLGAVGLGGGGSEIAAQASESAGGTLVRRIEPCSPDGVTGPVECGVYEVYEDRTAARGRTVSIRFRRIPARDGDGSDDPVVFMEGGPGASSIGLSAFVPQMFAGVHRDRDLVFIDQRGAGESDPLACEAPLPGGEGSLFGVMFPEEHIRRCRESLAATVDLAQYTTPTAADDVAEILRWLGYERVNLFGVSYGTRLALVFARRHPEMVRTAVLNGVAPTDRIVYLEGPVEADASLDWLFRFCASDTACRRSHGDIRAAWQRLIAQFAAGPVRTQARLSDGSRIEVDLFRDDFAYAVRGMLYRDLADSLPQWIARTDRTGDWSAFADYYVQRANWVTGSFATAMHLAVLCSEDVPALTESAMTAADRTSFMGAGLIRRYAAACRDWPTATLPADYRRAIRPRVPLLVISGERDPGTPPAWGESLAGDLPGALHVIIRDAGHVPMEGCIPRLVHTFYQRASVDGLKAVCAGEAVSTR